MSKSCETFFRPFCFNDLNIIFANRKAKQKRNEEKELLTEFTRLQEKLRSNFSKATIIEIDRVKKKACKNSCL